MSSLKEPDQSEEVSQGFAATAASSGIDSCDKSQNSEMSIPKLEQNLDCGNSGSSVEDGVSVI